MTAKAPLAAMTREAVGYWGGIAAAVIASLLMVLNINAWVWGPSRLAFAAAREGLIYKPLSVVGKHGTPSFALLSMLVPYIIILLIMLVQQSFMFETLITIVNANFIFLYLLTILAFTKCYKNITDYFMSAIAFMLTLYLFVQFGVFAAICLVLFAIVAVVTICWNRTKRPARIFIKSG
jgi:amino acid efflux transporter